MIIYNLERLREQLDVHELDAIIATTRENILYVAGFDPVIKTLNPYYGQCYAVITRDTPERVNIVHSIGEIDQLLDVITPLGFVHPYGCFYREYFSTVTLSDEEMQLQKWSRIEKAYQTPEQALSALLTVLGIEHGRIGYDQDGFTSKAFAGLQATLPQVHCIPASDIFRQIRRVKTSYEIELLARSARCNEQAIAEVVAHLEEGMSETEIAHIFEKALIEQGARPGVTMIKIGRHAIGGQRRQQEEIRLAPRDLLWFDSDTIYRGFWSDIARVYAYREAPSGSERYDALASGMQAAIANISPGMTGSEVFKLTMQAVHEAGFPEYRRHHVGHGIGLEPYERPILNPTETMPIEAGMVLCIETPFYEFGFGALHIEDPILIGNETNHILTNHVIGSLPVVNE